MWLWSLHGGRLLLLNGGTVAVWMSPSAHRRIRCGYGLRSMRPCRAVAAVRLLVAMRGARDKIPIMDLQRNEGLEEKIDDRRQLEEKIDDRRHATQQCLDR